MNLPDNLLSFSWYAGGWLLFVLLLAVAVWRAPWSRLADSGSLNLWLGNCVILMLMWSMKAGVQPGLNFHLLGAMLMTLEFGPALAFLGMAVVLAGVTLNGAVGWQGFGLNALLMGAVPVACSYLIWWLGNRFLPKNLFVFIFANGFFGSGLAMLATGIVSSLLLGAAGIYPLAVLAENYLPYFVLLGFSEAWIAGMVLTLMVVYRPAWISTFDEARYLAKRS